ncbi:NUDIX hydrolase [Chloroflexota bacterium]
MKQQLKQALSRRQKSCIVDTGKMPSAVLLPVYYKQGEYHILFTMRTDKVKAHKGQISFPGGAYEEHDGILVNTALRECSEEICLVAEDVEILGELDDIATFVSNYIISPFVAVIPWPYQFKADPFEVEEIIEVPISKLLDESCLHKETEFVNGEEFIAYFYHYQDKVIWGATARILAQFLDIYTNVINKG